MPSSKYCIRSDIIEQEAYGEVDVIAEMPEEIARADVVSDVAGVTCEKDMVAQGAGSADTLDVARVLGVPDGEVRLAGERLTAQQGHVVVVIADGVAYARGVVAPAILELLRVGVGEDNIAADVSLFMACEIPYTRTGGEG